MRIAIDLTQIPTGKTGVGTIAVNLVREFLRINDSSRDFVFYFFAQDDDDEWKNQIPNTENCRFIPINSRIYRKLIFRFFFEQFLLPRKCKKLGVQLLYSLHYSMPYFTRLKGVVLFHDMTFYLFPELHRRIKLLYFKFLIPLSLKKSSGLITVSDSTKRDLLERFPALAPDKIDVIHLGVNVTPPPPRAKTHLDTFGLQEKKYFLFVGTLEPRKNIPHIIRAFHQVIKNGIVTSNDSSSSNYNEIQQTLLEVREPFLEKVSGRRRHNRDDFKLVIVGKQGWFYREIYETVKAYNLEEAVVFTGYVEEEVKQSLLANAFVFVYPSIYEGFGLPVLEAMAYGVPVITANISSLPEVSGDAALLIDPRQWQEIADAMFRLLSDKELYAELSEKSRAQAARFSWRLTARKTLDLFKRLTANT